MISSWIIIAVLEGFTEFLPISSTAHLIILSKILAVDLTNPYIKFYLLVIQFGALCAGIIFFGRKLINDRKLLRNITISFIPSAIVGFLLYKTFKVLLEGDFLLLSTALFVGGVIFIYLEKVYMKKRASSLDTFGKKEITTKDAFILGFAQALAIIPGVSRSGATIIAGIFRGIKRSVMIEYTFLLAIPTLGAAVLYDAYKSRDMLILIQSYTNIEIGMMVSFGVGLFTLYFLQTHLSKITLTSFGWYRIILAIIVFLLYI